MKGRRRITVVVKPIERWISRTIGEALLVLVFIFLVTSRAFGTESHALALTASSAL